MKYKRVRGYHISDARLGGPESIDPSRFSVNTLGGSGLFIYTDEVRARRETMGRKAHYVEAEGNVFDLTDPEDQADHFRAQQDIITAHERGEIQGSVSSLCSGEFYDSLARKHSADMIRLNEDVLVIKNMGCITALRPF